MDNLAIILSHCDAPEKINLLKKLIKRLKSLNIDILLCSHLHLEASIQQEVTYYIYDKDNPILYWPERGTCVWFDIMDTKTLVRLSRICPDYGWTVMDQIKKASNFALLLKYNHYSFINYDAILTDQLDSYLVNPSETQSPVIFTHQRHRSLSVSTIFTVVKRNVLEKINVYIDKSNYLKYTSPEHHWDALLSPYDPYMCPSPIFDEGCNIERVAHNQNHFNDDFKVFFQNGNMPNQPRLPKACFFDIKDNTSIEIKCNDQNHLIEKASIIDLPTNVTKLGFFDNGAYCDFLPEFDEAKLRHHSIAPLPSI